VKNGYVHDLAHQKAVILAKMIHMPWPKIELNALDIFGTPFLTPVVNQKSAAGHLIAK
jgi:hypothetical protein